MRIWHVQLVRSPDSDTPLRGLPGPFQQLDFQCIWEVWKEYTLRCSALCLGRAACHEAPSAQLLDQLWIQSMDDTKKKCFDSFYTAPAEGGECG